MPDVRIPEQEEKASKTMQLEKEGSLLLTRARASAATNAVVQGQKKPRAQAVTQMYRVCISGW